MKSKQIWIGVVLALCMILYASPAYAAGPVFTGDASADFAGIVGTKVVVDNGMVPDVGLPPTIAGPSGFDISRIYLYYETDPLSPDFDTLFIGIECFSNLAGTICGDADNDGDPGGTSPALAALGGVDLADLGGTETFSIFFDFDFDDIPEAAAGVAATSDDLTDIGTYEWPAPGSPAFLDPTQRYGVAVGQASSNPTTAFASPSAGAPDLEFKIEDFSTMPGNPMAAGDPLDVRINAIAGAFNQDDGVGEDLLPPTAIELDSFTAVPGETGATIAWVTAAEIDNAGFNLYRSTSKDGAYERVNTLTIAARGNSTGATYEFTDDTVSDGIYYYMLEDIDVDGIRTTHDPVMVIVGGRQVMLPIMMSTGFASASQ